MNDLATKRSSAPATKANSLEESETLPSLFGRLGEQITTLVDLRLSLLKVEIREDVDAYIRRGVTIGIGALIVAVGFALANVAVSFFISTLFADFQLSQPARYGLGFISTGLIYVIVGGTIVLVTSRRLAAQELLPRRSLAELEKDKQMMKDVIQG